MTKQEILKELNLKDRLAKTIVEARLDYIGTKTYTLHMGETVYSIRKTGKSYSMIIGG